MDYTVRLKLIVPYCYLEFIDLFSVWSKDQQYYALINRAQGPYEEIFVLTYAYEPNEVRLIRALLYTYTNKIVSDEMLLSYSVVYCVSALPSPYAGPYAYVRTASQPVRWKNSFRISVSVQ